MSRTRQIAATPAVVLGGVAVLPAVSLLALLGRNDIGLTRNEWLWIIGATLLGLSLLVGLVLRLREEAPRLGTGLMALGALAPSVAWFWFPPLYLLSLAVFVLALLSHARRASAAAP